MLDLAGLAQAVATHGRVTRVVIAALRGSSPREVGAAMLIWADGQSGTIGGGALEHEAAKTARRMLVAGDHVPRNLSTHALGPDLGQCCGGSVTLGFEQWDAKELACVTGDTFARSFTGTDRMPLSARRLLTDARGRGAVVESQLCDGWLIEPIYRPSRSLWIWGAGHVGRAMVSVFAPLPEFEITWVDTDVDRFPDTIAAGVTMLPAKDPALLVSHAPPNAEHLILTYSHALDLELCHRLLGRGFSFAGVIGSATKWARFRSRLRQLGHSSTAIDRLVCPIGDPALGKHPQAIAIGVASQLIQLAATTNQNENNNDLRELKA
jgi:xanthine dehydrogenase accessory factor